MRSPGKAIGHGEAGVGGGSEANMTDDDLRRDVAAELCWDPQVDSAAIAVSAASGMVTLRGTVASLRHKRAAGGHPPPGPRGTPGGNELRGADPDRGPRRHEDPWGGVPGKLVAGGSA